MSFESAVLLIRNPYNVLEAENNWMAGGHVGVAEPEYFKINEGNYMTAGERGSNIILSAISLRLSCDHDLRPNL